MKNLIIVSFTLFYFTACSVLPTQPKPVEVITVAEPMPMYHPPLPIELNIVDIDWEILTPRIMKEYLSDLEQGSAPPTAYYALTSKDYENLSMNMAEIKRYIKDTLHILEFYRDYDKQDQPEEKVSDTK
jgi:hypothetical protein